ncbi:hypothetical protein CHOTACABRAS_197 [Bacillus phage Chotacabras]|nr:hypothetical protein CHOTACABRAS_197 [Bacillus phage Chotacabras]
MMTMVQAPDRPEDKLVEFMISNNFSKADIYAALQNIEEANMVLYSEEWNIKCQNNYVWVKGELTQ